MSTSFQGFGSVDELESHWQQQVQQAQRQYRQAVGQHIRMAEEARRDFSGQPEGLFFVARARRAEAAAFRQLFHAVRIYSELVLKGKMPHDEDEAAFGPG